MVRSKTGREEVQGCFRGAQGKEDGTKTRRVERERERRKKCVSCLD